MKWLKYTVLALAPIVLIAGIWMFMGRGTTQMPDGTNFVDVTTGKVQWMKRDSYLTIPARNSAGLKVMFPVVESEAGGFKLHPRYAEYLNTMISEGKLTAEQVKVDLATFQVRAE